MTATANLLNNSFIITPLTYFIIRTFRLNMISMKSLFCSILFSSLCQFGFTQHTFSIAAVDSITNEIGSAGATCLSQEDGALYVSDIILNVGAINTQAWWTLVNQSAARQQMENGLSPQEIIDWLRTNDNPSQGGRINDRQYGIVDLNNGSPRAAAFTGTNNFNVAGQRVGPNYAIQGNILISEEVLDDMETAFLQTEGPLCDKLMASMQAAKRPGADARCLPSGISSASAYIRVAQPTDTNSNYGQLWMDINSWLDSGEFTGDPIDDVQRKFDLFKATVSTEDLDTKSIYIYPNPTSGELYIQSGSAISKVEIYNMLGHKLADHTLSSNNRTTSINIDNLPSGPYLLQIWQTNTNTRETKIVYKTR